MTCIADDTTIWANNAHPSVKAFKRELEPQEQRKDLADRGAKKTITVLGQIQRLSLRRANEPGGIGDTVQVHSPAQVVPKSNAFTILARLRQWGLYTSAGTCAWFGGDDLFKGFEQIPLKLKIHCSLVANTHVFIIVLEIACVLLLMVFHCFTRTNVNQTDCLSKSGNDALPANRCCIAKEALDWSIKRLAKDRNACSAAELSIDCLHHQASLAKKPGILSLPGLASGLVRMGRAMRTTKFQQNMNICSDYMAKKGKRVQVIRLPTFVEDARARNAEAMGFPCAVLNVLTLRFFILTLGDTGNNIIGMFSPERR